MQHKKWNCSIQTNQAKSQEKELSFQFRFEGDWSWDTFDIIRMLVPYMNVCRVLLAHCSL